MERSRISGEHDEQGEQSQKQYSTTDQYAQQHYRAYPTHQQHRQL
jgi:hypothetical protein